MIDRHVALAASGSIIAGHGRDALQQRGLARAVLSYNDRDGAIEAKLEIVGQERQAERIGLPIVDPRWIEPDPLEIRCRQVDVALSPSRHWPAHTPEYAQHYSTIFRT